MATSVRSPRSYAVVTAITQYVEPASGFLVLRTITCSYRPFWYSFGSWSFFFFLFFLFFFCFILFFVWLCRFSSHDENIFRTFPSTIDCEYVCPLFDILVRPLFFGNSVASSKASISFLVTILNYSFLKNTHTFHLSFFKFIFPIKNNFYLFYFIFNIILIKKQF
eukprot:SAG11_NODE_1206_length_5528_cov_20.313502_5_plen_165_part_00